MLYDKESLSLQCQKEIRVIKKLEIMKRLFLMVMAVVAFSAVNAKTNEMFNVSTDAYKLCDYLKVTDDATADKVADINEFFNQSMQMIANSPKEELATRVKTCVEANKIAMKKILTADQFAKYNAVLNVTLKNKGLDVYMK